MDWVIEMKPVAQQPEQRNATSRIAVDPIERIEAVWLRCPIEPESQATSDFGAMETFSTVIVRITSRSGVVGHGETKAAGGSVSLNYALIALIERELGPQLIGKNAFDIAGNWEELYNGIRNGYARAKGRAFPSLGRRGLTLCAIAGIDIALWDLVGRAVGLPASQLMGGRIRHSIPLYASGGWAPLPKIGDEVRRYVDSGFKAIKMRVGSKDGPVGASAARVAAARNAIGPSLELMVDAHGTFNVSEAKRFARLVQDANLRWFEEPVTGEDKEGLAEIRRSTDIPIAAGENEFTRFDFREYAERRALDVWQPDLSICGGLTEGLRISALAATHQVELAPHYWGGPLTMAASAHLASVSPAVAILEYPVGANPMMHRLNASPWPVKDGVLEIPGTPGLGIELDEDFMKKWRVDV
jgi:L-alanine-DL-glutamate epimerase-like enolase superfamily enzyme